MSTWLNSLPQRVQPLLLTVRQNESPVGVAMLVSRTVRRLGCRIRQLHFNSTGEAELDCITIEYNDFVGPYSPNRLWPAFLAWFAQRGDFDEIVVPGILQDAIRERIFTSGLLRKEIVSPAYLCLLPSPGSPDAILSRLSSNARQQLRRNLRDFDRIGPLACERAGDVETALAWFDALKNWHIESWLARGRPHAFSSAFFEPFHRALIASGVSQGSVDLLRISAGEKPIGYLYNFRSADRVMAYQSGFDQDLQDKRPGYVSHFLAMEMSARKGAACYDFLAGDNQLKRSFSNRYYAMSSVTYAKAGPRAYLEGALHVARNTLSHKKKARVFNAGLLLGKN